MKVVIIGTGFAGASVARDWLRGTRGQTTSSPSSSRQTARAVCSEPTTRKTGCRTNMVPRVVSVFRGDPRNPAVSSADWSTSRSGASIREPASARLPGHSLPC